MSTEIHDSADRFHFTTLPQSTNQALDAATQVSNIILQFMHLQNVFRIAYSKIVECSEMYFCFELI